MKNGKLVVLSASSGAGKSTICKDLLKKNNDWKFSISATTRPMRENEVDGKDYYFLGVDGFKNKIKKKISESSCFANNDTFKRASDDLNTYNNEKDIRICNMKIGVVPNVIIRIMKSVK